MRGVRKQRTAEEEALFQLDKDITKELELMLPAVLERTKYILDYPIETVQSLHGKIGGKNNEYANVADTRFHDYREFQRTWAKGMVDKIQSSNGGAVFDIAKLYKDDLCRQYILKFQERNFYREYNNRIRQKPASQLWNIWFGNQLVYGLLIAPELQSDGTWRIDHSEIRRVPYHYWTIGHILAVGGFVNPVLGCMFKIQGFNDLENFYLNIVATSANAYYERPICQLYLKYLRNSTCLEDEPFLIPEFHYEGYRKACKYRMDFTILNPHTFRYTCFELSPASSHFSIEKAKYKTQAELNADIAKMWQYECAKRNAYLGKFNLSTHTFTDSDLQSPEMCFSIIASYLSERPTFTPSMTDVLGYLNSLNF